MPIYNLLRFLKVALLVVVPGTILLLSGCEKNIFQSQTGSPPAMRDVPAVRLNYRYEADVPPPSDAAKAAAAEERNAGVQADFDALRPYELLDRTLSSPDKKRVLAIYHRISDIQSEYRLDIYSPDGKLLRKLTSDTMAVHFPETIVWSPDSASLAFVAMIRAGQEETGAGPVPTLPPANTSANTQTTPAANSNSEQANSDPVEATPLPVPTPAAPTGILTFHTEQIYICGADGTGIKAITNNEALIYFYYVWSPDSTMVAALAASSREWKILDVVAASKGEIMVPLGRPRIIEKNGRERRLDDNLTAVRPVWSPDSSKVADAFDTQVRIYDANGTNPTQAAVPLRNQLLISSQAYDRDQQRKLQAANANLDPNVSADTSPTPDQPVSTLPDEKLLVSYNPVVTLVWTADDLLYLETAYVRRMKNEADSARSFSRWHRLVLTPQYIVPNR